MKNKLTKDFLQQKYLIEGLSTVEIARLVGCVKSTVRYNLIKHDIKRRQGVTKKYKLLPLDRVTNLEEPSVAYFLGFIAADGCIRRTKYSEQLRIKIHKRDVRLLEDFKSLFKLTNPIVETKAGQVALTVIQNNLLNSFSMWNIVPNKSLRMEFPEGIPSKLLRHYIRGYFDGDGHISTVRYKRGNPRVKNIGFTTGSETFARGLCHVLTSKCIKCSLRNEKNTIYRVSLSNKSFFKFYNYLYLPERGESQVLCLDRKRLIFEEVRESLNNHPLKGSDVS